MIILNENLNCLLSVKYQFDELLDKVNNKHIKNLLWTNLNWPLIECQYNNLSEPIILYLVNKQHRLKR